MTETTLTISDKQQALIARAHLENAGWVDDLIEIKGGARLKMLQALERRGLIEPAEADGLAGFRLTALAIDLVEAAAPIADPVPLPETSVEATIAATDPLQTWTPAWQVALAADGIEQLRACDLERVLRTNDLSEEQQFDVAAFIIEQRPELAAAVNALFDAPSAATACEPAPASKPEPEPAAAPTPEPTLTPEQAAMQACRDCDGDLEAFLQAQGIAGEARERLVRDLEVAGLATPLSGLDHWHLEPLYVRGFRAGVSASGPLRKPRQSGKQAEVIALLKRPEGATIADMSAATGWQAHTVRSVISSALRRKLGLTVTAAPSDSEPGKQRVYRIIEQAA
ncbi:DUF3489 domain-containing protein [Lamprobacter modestohalophilus]|uniref:DUF3489 domain-containing protein n=1 Tax=Lamprobacter modestohalophilus TaxID=1064514 RepID=UPI002ADEAE89|nr:DUF3489 domain-containing protein [Lamprobacter modestohalophilus]MEA1052344.1 DUF3489 domain-containing protein [Lamprobacter modestohalophilus]